MRVRLRMIGLLDEEIIRRLRADFADVQVLADANLVADETIDALLAWEANVEDIVAALREHRSLRWVHDNAAGIPPALIAALAGQSTVLTNGSGAQSSAVAEYVVAVLLTFLKRLRELGRFQARAEWVTGFHPAELRGLTVGIIGLGNAGLAIARVLRPFGVRLLGMRRHPEPVPDVEAVYPRGDMRQFLAQLEVLVIAAPLTEETRGMIGAAQLAQLRSGAYLVNVGRGAIVDEEALVAALRSGQLGGAALDVFTVEPLPPTSPLWALPNAIVSPHYCDQTPQTDERGRDLFFDNLRRYVQGEPLRNVVDRRLGY
jgi:phosphoglycerate dehydrogenase-like enzyme